MAASTNAFLLQSVEPVLCDNVQATDANGVALWFVTLDARTTSGTKHHGHRIQVAGANGAGIRQAVKAYVRALDDTEKVVKPKTPQAILDLIGQPVDLQLNPVTDWDAVVAPLAGG